jgi:hypothetical protein
VIQKFKNIISLFLLLVFIFPSVIKLEHHHETVECKVKNEQHLHEFHEKCVVCNFEFSLFSVNLENIVLQNEQPVDKYFNNYGFDSYSGCSKYSFSLRAPPVKQV